MMDVLFRHLAESTVVLLPLAGLTYCLRRQAASVRHAVWLAAAVKFSLPTVLLTTMGARMAATFPASVWILPIARKLTPLLAGLFAFLPTHLGIDEAAFAPALAAVWALGSAWMCIDWLKRFPRLGDLPAAPDREQEALERAKRRCGFHGPVSLRSAGAGTIPSLSGIRRPVITIPQGLSAQLTEAEFQAVLLHELAHARRRDNLASAFVHCLVCLFWFHPLVWFVERRTIAERERACDEMVLESGIFAETYLDGLVKVCRFQIFGEIAGLSAAAGSDLMARFDQILSYRERDRRSLPVRLFMAVLLCYLAVLPVAGGYCEQCVSNGEGMTGRTLTEQPFLVRSSAGFK